MSAKVHWRPVQPIHERLGDLQLREIMTKRYQLPYQFGTADCDYIRGLMDAGVEGAKEMLEAIKRHGIIELFLDN